MKKLFLVVLIILALAFPVFAIDVTLSWDAQSDADGFRIYRTIDEGATWEQVGNDIVGATTVTLTNQPDTGLVLYRISAFNAWGETILAYKGVWIWVDIPKPPIYPTGVGVQ